VAQRVGSGPVRVDVAVLDGENGRYTLGIECDGDNAFLARSARDRDRIQGQVLQRLGWRIHRVWSQQWWQDQAGEREKLLKQIEQTAKDAKGAKDAFKEPTFSHIPSVERYDARPELAEPRSVPEYVRCANTIEIGKGSFFSFYSTYNKSRAKGKENWNKLVALMVEIVRTEQPIHIEEVGRRMSHAAGRQVSTMDDQTAERLVKEGTKAGLIMARGDFLYGVEGKRPSVRNRAKIKGVSRKFSYIAPEEIQEAILLVVGDALGIPLDDVPLRVARLLGYRQINAKSKTIVIERIERLLKYGLLIEYRGELFLDEKPHL
jgi:hypothetical protein